MKTQAGDLSKGLLLAVAILVVENVHGQVRQDGPFVAYETMEMAMNEFKNFAGEAGYRFDSKYQIRFSIMEVELTERHLSSKWEAAAISGKNVEGYMRGYEVHVDRFFAGNWYVSASLGYYEDTYRHIELDESLENRTMTVGSGIGYSRSNLFGIRNLYFNFDIPVRYYFNPIEETMLGESTVRPHVVVNNVWIFLGWRF